MPALNLHVYLSTACQHEDIDGNPDLHAACRETCKFCDAPCACPQHPHGAATVVTWIDQARSMARELYGHAVSAGALPLELVQRAEFDPALFWLRGEEAPPGAWHPEP
jgi:hypothetical protein